jgi:hypothetical protein
MWTAYFSKVAVQSARGLKMEKNTILASVLSVLATSLIILGGVSLFDKDVYFCEDTNIVMRCDSLSKYYGLLNGKCNNAEVGNKLCRSGWLEVENDMELEIAVEEPKTPVTPLSSSKYRCDVNKCVPI